MKPMDTFLPPIEKHTGLMKKLVFAMTRRQVGKVLTPLKVFTARLPLRFGQFYAKVSQLDKKLMLSPETALLIRQHRSMGSNQGIHGSGQTRCAGAVQHEPAIHRR